MFYDVRSVPGVDDGRYMVSVVGSEDAVVRASSAAESPQQLELEMAPPEEADSIASFDIFDLTPFAPELDEGALSGDRLFGSTILSDSFGRFEVQLYRRNESSRKWIAIGRVDIGSSSRWPWRRIGVVTLLPITVAADLVLLPFVGLRYLWAYCYYS